MKNHHLNILVFFIGILFLFTSCKEQSSQSAHEEEATHTEEIATSVVLTTKQMQTVAIELGKIETKELTTTIKVNGFLSVPNNNKGLVTSLFGGVVQSLHIQIGDKVKKGQTIAILENVQFLQIQEDYLAVRSQLQLSEQELKRQQTLKDGNAGALKNLQSAQAALQQIKARFSSLKEQLSLMGISTNQLMDNQLKATIRIKSPIDGVVSKVSGQIGSYVDAQSPLAEIVDNRSLHLDLNVFEKDLPKLKVGQIIHFTLTNNPIKEYDAVIYSIGASFSTESKTIIVHCNVTGDKTGLIDGMNVNGIVSLNKASLPAVPSSSIVSDGVNTYLFIAHPEKKSTYHFERKRVLCGVSNMGFTEITPIDDFSLQSEIVTNGAFFINAKLTGTGEEEHQH